MVFGRCYRKNEPAVAAATKGNGTAKEKEGRSCHHSLSTENGKNFEKEDGDYVDFEEVK